MLRTDPDYFLNWLCVDSVLCLFAFFSLQWDSLPLEVCVSLTLTGFKYAVVTGKTQRLWGCGGLSGGRAYVWPS